VPIAIATALAAIALLRKAESRTERVPVDTVGLGLLLLAVGALVLLVADSAGKSLIALGVVLVAAAAGGIGFSWKRYYRR